MQAARIYALEAQSIGLIDEVITPSRIWSRAQSIIAELKSYSSQSFAAHKVAREAGSTLQEREASIFEELWWSPAHRQALARFAGRRD